MPGFVSVSSPPPAGPEINYPVETLSGTMFHAMGINLIKKYLAGMGNCLSLPPDLKIMVAVRAAASVGKPESSLQRDEKYNWERCNNRETFINRR